LGAASFPSPSKRCGFFFAVPSGIAPPAEAQWPIAEIWKHPNPLWRLHKGFGTHPYSLLSLREELRKWHSLGVKIAHADRRREFSAPPAALHVEIDIPTSKCFFFISTHLTRLVPEPNETAAGTDCN